MVNLCLALDIDIDIDDLINNTFLNSNIKRKIFNLFLQKKIQKY